MTVDGGRCRVEPREITDPDLTVRCRADVFLGIHRGTINPVLALLTGRVRLEGQRRLFLAFPRLLGFAPGDSWLHRMAYQARKLWARARGRAAS